jgi:uncharacterized protein YjbI with pentapeptide repeats
MSAAAPPVAILLTPSGLACGVAWTTTTAAGTELTVVGKLEFAFTSEGEPRPVQAEPPGHWQARPSPEELEAAQGRRLVVRGQRPLPGRVLLRRGTTSIAELELAPGATPAAGQLASASMSTVVGTPADEWLVVEGFDGPRSRRWCKLPRVGLLASWQCGSSTPERLLLGARQCFVDVARGSFAFVLRGTRRLSANSIPQRVELVVTDLAPLVNVTPARGDLGTTLPLDGGAVPVAGPIMPFAGASGAPAPPPPQAPGVLSPPPFAAPAVEGSSLPRLGIGLPSLAERSDEITRTDVATTRLISPLAPTKPSPVLPFDVPDELESTSALDPTAAPETDTLPFGKSPRSAAPSVEPGSVGYALTIPVSSGRRLGGHDAPEEALESPGTPSIAPESVEAGPVKVELHEPRSMGDVHQVILAPPPDQTSLEQEGVVSLETHSVRIELERRLCDGASLAGLELRSADLSRLELRHAKLGGLDLSLANLSGADLTSADLTRSKLDGARLDGAKLDGAILARASFEGASLDGASLRDIQARECSFVEAQLAGCDLTSADLRRAKLVGATLVGAQCARLNGLESDWTGADLGEAKLEQANLRGATLRRARLDGASFVGTDLRDADLREASPAVALEGAKLAGARRG